MKINSIDEIDSEAGDYILLTDQGYEGLAVAAQFKTLEDLMQGMGNHTYSSSCTVVKLIDIQVTEFK